MKTKLLANFKYLVLIIGIGFVVLGVLRGEVHQVLIKSTTICLECIGIG